MDPARPSRLRRLWLPALLTVLTLGVVAAIATGESGGTGAALETTATAPAPRTDTSPPRAAPTDDAERPERAEREPARDCRATESNPGGTNNYIPDAPAQGDLGEGYAITGTVRRSDGCRPLSGVRLQVWLADATGGETENRTRVRTDARGRFRVDADQPAPQFGEPNIHVAYTDPRYDELFLRRVVDRDADGATIDIVLRRRG